MQHPKVSVCIPSYNHARFLPAAIESILAQTYKNLEIVIIDDASTDGSFEIANTYSTKYPQQIKVYTHPEHRNRGISATVNLGFRLSTGEYWSGLPSDDLLHPRKIEEQVAYLEEHPEVDWVYCYAYYVDEQGNRRPEYGLFGEDITRTGNPVEYLLLGNVIPGMTPLMRRSAVARIEPHDESLVYSDWDFWIRLASHSPVAFQPRARVLYRMHGANTGFGSDHKTNLWRGVPVLLKLKKQAVEIGGPLSLPRTRALIELQLCYFLFAIGSQAEAEEALAVAFRIDESLAAECVLFLRWLKFVNGYPDLGRIRFVDWVVGQLPAVSSVTFIAEVQRALNSRAFRRDDKYLRLKAHWRSRKRILEVFKRDPEALTDGELRRFYLEALLGSKVRSRLSGLLR